MAKTATAKKTAEKPAEKKGKVTEGATPTTSTEVVAIPKINKSAMSLDVGPSVVANLAEFAETEARLHQELEELKPKRYDALSRLTVAFVKAATNDDQIDLNDVFKGDQKLYNPLLDKLYIATGVKHVVTVGEGEKARQRIAYSPEVMKYFPSAKDDGTDPLYRKKQTLRSNFLHQTKKAIMAAAGVVNRNITVELDKKEGTLAISGKAVKEVFGRDEVLLNEKQTVDTGRQDKEGKAITAKLKAKPSFTQLAQIGAASQGTTIVKRVDSRTSGTAVEADKALIAILNSALTAINRYSGELTDDVKKAMNAVNNAIATKLEA